MNHPHLKPASPTADSYKLSGNVPLSGLLLTLGLGSLGSAVLGVGYAFAINYIPFIAFRMILPIVLGIGVGLIVATLAIYGHLRNVFVAALSAVACGLVTLWVAWIFDEVVRFPDDAAAFIRYKPGDLIEYVARYYQVGFWRSGLNPKNNVKGMILAVGWIGEIVFVCGMAANIVHASICGKLYCERCSCWAKPYGGQRNIHIKELHNDQLHACLEKDLRHVHSFATAKSDDDDHIRIEITACPNCNTSHYLSATLVWHTQDKKGQVLKLPESLSDYRHLTPDEVDFIEKAPL